MATSLNLGALARRHREGGSLEVRALLWSHLDAGKRLDAEGYGLLLATYTRAKPDKRLSQLLDDVLAGLAGRGAKKLLDPWKAGALLQPLAALLVEARRDAEALEVHARYFDLFKTMPVHLHLGLFEVAARLGGAALRRALEIHQRILKKEPDLLEVTKIAKAAAAAEASLQRAGGAPPLAPPSTTSELESLCAAIDRAGGKAKGAGGERFARPEPLAPDALAALRLPGGKKLPPSLARWLAFDATWLPLLRREPTLGWDAVSLRDFFAAYGASIGLDPAAGADLAKGQPLRPTARVVVLPGSADEDHLLVLDKVGKDGEVPVYGRSKEELFEKYRSFGSFIVDYLAPDARARGQGRGRASAPAARRAR